QRCAVRIDVPLSETLHLDKTAPCRVRRDLIVALDERGASRRICRAWVVNIDIHQLRSERAAKRRRQIAGLNAEDDVAGTAAVVVDLEVGDVESSSVEVTGRRIRVVAWAIVIAARVGDVEDLGPGDEVPNHRAAPLSRA